MIIVFYALVGLTLIILQTAFLPHFHSAHDYYNLLIPLIVFLGLFRPLKEGLVVAITFGFFMDGLSGGTFGLFTTAFFWIFLGVKWMITFLHAGSWMILPFVMAGSVVVENVVSVLGSSLYSNGYNQFILDRVISQIIWAAATGPIIVWGIKYLIRKWLRWFRWMNDSNES
jgi:cell shape-determining protein MreD